MRKIASLLKATHPSVWFAGMLLIGFSLAWFVRGWISLVVWIPVGGLLVFLVNYAENNNP